MALKRKQHEEQEEQRRQMVLEQRRRQMIDVTNKFQRLGRRQTCNNNNNNNAAGPQLHCVNNMSLCLFTFHCRSLELLSALALSVEQSRLLLELLPTVLFVRPGPT